MLKRIALWLTFSLIFPVAICAQSADSLRLLWKNEAISGVTAHAFSHSGNVLALASNHEIMFWDLKAGRFVRTISIPSHNYDQMAFNQTDEEIVLLSPPEIPHFSDCGFGQQRPAVGCEIRVDLRTEKADEIREAYIKKGKWALSPDGSIIALLTDSGKLSVRDSRDFSIHSSVMFPPVSKSYLADVYSGWIPPYGVWFSPNGNDVITLWGGQAVVFDAFSLPNHKIITDSVDKWRSPYIKGEGVFIPEEKSSQAAEILSEMNYEPSDLQPPIAYVPDVSKWTDKKGKTNRPKSAILFGNGKYLASRYAVWLEHLIDYGTARGEDTLIITSPSNPEYEWGIGLSNFMDVLDVMPDNNNQLLLGDGSTFMILDAEQHTVKYLTSSTFMFAGFGKDGQTVLERNQRDLYSFDGQEWKRVGWAAEAETGRASGSSFLKDYLRVLPAGDSKVFAYCDFWSKNDSAHIFDLRTGEVLASFIGGLNQGIEAGAVSNDKKWVVTISPEGGGKLWRASDAALTTCFAANGAGEAAFTKNNRYLLCASIYGNDSGVSLIDLKNGQAQKICFGDARVSGFELNEDASRLAVFRWHAPACTMGPAVIELYETPMSWRNNDTSFDPKTVYLPLRFYLPGDAPDALDSTGAKYNPPRTHVELELRYADGRLLEKILDGAYHKGKWHIWEYEMTKYLKGTYIMHTEIGGVVKDEKMEVR